VEANVLTLVPVGIAWKGKLLHYHCSKSYHPAISARGVSMTGGLKKKIERHPRLLHGNEAGLLIQFLRSEPAVTIHLKEKNPSILFSFQIDASTNFPELLVHQAFFGPWKDLMESQLQEAYKTARFNNKRVSALIANLLRLVVKEGLRTWIDRSWSIRPEYESRKGEHLANFAKDSKSGHGPQPNSLIALCVSKRWPETLAVVKKLRRDLNSKFGSLSPAALIDEFKNNGLQYQDIREALGRILPEQNNINPRAFFTSKIRPRDIVKAL
jgi:hypothetical protein